MGEIEAEGRVKITVDLSYEQVLALLFFIETIERTELTKSSFVNSGMKAIILSLRRVEAQVRG